MVKFVYVHLLVVVVVVVVVVGLVCCSCSTAYNEHQDYYLERDSRRFAGSLWNPFSYRTCDRGAFRFKWMKDEEGSSFECLNNRAKQSQRPPSHQVHDAKPTNESSKWSKRITSGFEAQLGEFPSYVRVKHRTSESRVGTCGGMLLNKFLVLTAAHCIQYEGFAFIQAGSINGKDKAQRYKVRRACFPDLYFSREYDFAIMELEDEIEYNDNIQPGCLNLDFKLRKNIQCVVVGHGITKTDGNLSEPLKGAVVRNCAPKLTVHGGLQCMKVANKTSGYGQACSGDSGGPLFCFENCTGRPRMYSVGLVHGSFDPGCQLQNYETFTSSLSHRVGISKLIRTMIRQRSFGLTSSAQHLDDDMKPSEFVCWNYKDSQFRDL